MAEIKIGAKNQFGFLSNKIKQNNYGYDKSFSSVKYFSML